MTVSFAKDEYQRLTCTLARDAIQATATSSDVRDALDGMRDALASVEANGRGECFWKEGGGVYRWVFRREAGNVRVAVLWSSGVMQGWEHVFWAECPFDAALADLRAGLAQVTT